MTGDLLQCHTAFGRTTHSGSEATPYFPMRWEASIECVDQVFTSAPVMTPFCWSLWFRPGHMTSNRYPEEDLVRTEEVANEAWGEAHTHEITPG